MYFLPAHLYCCSSHALEQACKNVGPWTIMDLRDPDPYRRYRAEEAIRNETSKILRLEAVKETRRIEEGRTRQVVTQLREEWEKRVDTMLELGEKAKKDRIKSLEKIKFYGL